MKQWYMFRLADTPLHRGHNILVQAEGEQEALAKAKTDPQVSDRVTVDLKPMSYETIWDNAINWTAKVYMNSDSVEILNVHISADSSKPLIAIQNKYGGFYFKRILPNGKDTFGVEYTSYYMDPDELSRLLFGNDHIICKDRNLDFYTFGETTITGMSIMKKATRTAYVEKIKEQAIDWVDDQLDRHILRLEQLRTSVKSAIRSRGK